MADAKDETKTAENNGAKPPESQLEEPESRLSKYGIVLVIVGIVIAMAFAFYFWQRYHWNLDDAQMIGDASAPIAGAFTVGALVAALIALRLQTEELRLQRRELKASVQALNAQAAEARAANIQNEKALEFEKAQAALANKRAEESQEQQRKMSEAALAETQRANLRAAYATWLGHVDQLHARIQTYALDRINNTTAWKTRGVHLWDDLIRDVEEAATRSFFHVCLVDSRGLGLAKTDLLWRYSADRMGKPETISDASGKQRENLKEFASWLATAINEEEKPSVNTSSTPTESE
jgi:preprotein translocase subunit SecA